MKFLKNRAHIVDFCFFTVIAVLPFAMILSPIALGLLILAFLFFMDRLGLREVFERDRAILFMVLYFLFITMGVFYSMDLGIGYKRISTQLPLLLVPLLFTQLKLDLVNIRRAKLVFIISCTLFCVVAFIMLGYNFVVNYEHRLNYNFVQRSMYHFHYPYDDLYLNTATIFLLFGQMNKKYKIIVLILFFMFITLSGVRIGLFTFLLILFIYGLMNFKKYFNIKTAFGLVASFILVIVLMNTSQYVNDKFLDTLDKIGLGTKEYVSDIGENYHKMGLRNRLWSASYEVFKEKKFFGYGPNGSEPILNKMYLKKGYANLKGINSHNQYITTTLNHGLIGLFLLLSIFAIAIVKGFRVRNYQKLLVILIIMIAFSTESVLERQKGVMFFAIFLSILLIESSLLINSGADKLKAEKAL